MKTLPKICNSERTTRTVLLTRREIAQTAQRAAALGISSNRFIRLAIEAYRPDAA